MFEEIREETCKPISNMFFKLKDLEKQVNYRINEYSVSFKWNNGVE